ncbi:MAG: hypothetical protein AB1421_07975 [Pseudomonadota bacterium]
MDAAALSLLPGLDTYAALARGGPAVPPRREPESVVVPPVAAPVVVDSASLGGGRYAALQTRQDALNELALALRQEGREAGIRKLYPPYPPEQAERMAYLDDISGLRRQIESMLPPDGVPTPSTEMDREAATQAEQFSRIGRRLLADLPGSQAISSNRPLLEGVAQSDPII